MEELTQADIDIIEGNPPTVEKRANERREKKERRSVGQKLFKEKRKSYRRTGMERRSGKSGRSKAIYDNNIYGVIANDGKVGTSSLKGLFDIGI